MSRTLPALAVLALAAGLALSPSTASAQGRAGSETEEEAILKKAEEHFQNGDYDSAADLYDQAIKLDPNRVEAFVKRASLYFRERKYDQAIELLTRAEKLSVSDLSVKTALGLTLYESGQRERGLGYLEEVARQRPETHGAQFQLGKHYARIDPKRASQALEQYFRFRPEEDKRNDWEAQLLLGTAYYLGGNLTEARKLLEAGKIKPIIFKTFPLRQAAEAHAELERAEAKYGPVALNIVELALAGKHDQAIGRMNADCRPLLAALLADRPAAGGTSARRAECIGRTAHPCAGAPA